MRGYGQDRRGGKEMEGGSGQERTGRDERKSEMVGGWMDRKERKELEGKRRPDRLRLGLMGKKPAEVQQNIHWGPSAAYLLSIDFTLLTLSSSTYNCKALFVQTP